MNENVITKILDLAQKYMTELNFQEFLQEAIKMCENKEFPDDRKLYY
jgi:hypothetical protein